LACGRRPGRRAHGGRGVQSDSSSSPARPQCRSGMTGGPRLSAAAGAREWAVGWAAVRHWAAVAQVSQSKQLEGRWRTSGCWAANKNGPEEGKAEGEEEKGFDQFEKSTSK
jgi:hypothetical protein